MFVSFSKLIKSCVSPKTATRADEKLDLISLDEYLKKISVTVSPEDPEKPDEGEGGGDEGGGSGEAPDPAA